MEVVYILGGMEGNTMENTSMIKSMDLVHILGLMEGGIRYTHISKDTKDNGLMVSSIIRVDICYLMVLYEGDNGMKVGGFGGMRRHDKRS